MYKKVCIMANKNKMLSIRVPDKLLEEYQEFCEEHSMNISKRLRKFMERDIEAWNIKKKNNKDSI